MLVEKKGSLDHLPIQAALEIVDVGGSTSDTVAAGLSRTALKSVSKSFEVSHHVGSFRPRILYGEGTLAMTTIIGKAGNSLTPRHSSELMEFVNAFRSTKEEKVTVHAGCLSDGVDDPRSGEM